MVFEINCKSGNSKFTAIERSTNQKVELLLGKCEENGDVYEFSICYISNRKFIESSKNIELIDLSSIINLRYRKIRKIGETFCIN